MTKIYMKVKHKVINNDMLKKQKLPLVRMLLYVYALSIIKNLQ